MITVKKVLLINTDEKILRLFSSRGWETEVLSSVNFFDSISGTFIPDLIVISSLSEAKIGDLRKNELLYFVPVVILAESFAEENNFNSITNYQKIIVCNKVIMENEEFLEQLEGLAQKKRSLLPCKTSSLVEYAVLFMNKNVKNAVSRGDIAQQLGVNPDYLSRIFKKQMGIGMWDYFICLKMHRARKLILQTNDQLSVIAKQCGFKDPCYFSNQFKKFYNCTPASLRHN